MSRDLGDARLLFRGSPWVPWLVVGVGAATTAGFFVSGLLQPWPVAGAAWVCAPFAVVTLVSWWALRWTSATAEVWAAEDALIVRRSGDRWLRIPWTEISGGTWVFPDGRGPRGPAITTVTGGRYERPNPDHYTIFARPWVFGHLAGPRALRDELTRRGIPWTDTPDRSEAIWTSTRWDW